MEFNHQNVPQSFYSLMSNSQQIPHLFSFGVGNMPEFVQHDMLLDKYSGGELYHESENSLQTDCLSGCILQTVGRTEKKEHAWQRIKWTDEMVKLLITATSYVMEDATASSLKSERRKGKWSAISRVLAERGFNVTPQQSEDKFNDLNKKYKRLNGLLGQSLSREVVENPELIETMNISYAAKEEVKKLLTCRQLFYYEMWSYHSGNKMFLPDDMALQQSLCAALKGKSMYGSQNVTCEVPPKIRRNGEDNDDVLILDVPSNFIDHGQHNSQPLNNPSDFIDAHSEGAEMDPWIISRSLQLEEKRLQLEKQRIELEKEKFDWLQSIQEEERELRKMKQANDMMKLENEQLAFKIKCWENDVTADCNL